ncbi:MAG: hydrogenase formation protein HypD, partial [Clostridiales bacterium]|nr:hydrogenase formation protein HypD [Clostridiales bacterium]
IRMVYTPIDSLAVAAENPDKKVVFLSVGFETTAPIAALSVLRAAEQGLNNFSLLSANKTMKEALKLLSSDEGSNGSSINGFLYPGHVAAVTGMEMFEQLAESHGMPGVVAGFDPQDITDAIVKLIELIDTGRSRAINGYSRVVRQGGNPEALATMYKVFESCDSEWRGFGIIPGSGLAMKNAYRRFDAWEVFGIKAVASKEHTGCRCGEVLRGRLSPESCELFGRACTPENPAGACMVSSEGTCAAFYRYGGAAGKEQH